jgi:uncharacterized membrane protein
MVLAAGPVVFHFAAVTGRWPLLLHAVPLLQLLIVGAVLLTRTAKWRRWLSAAAVVSIAALVFEEAGRLNLVGISGIPHALAYSGLVAAFGTSLLPGHEAALTRVVRHLRGPLSPTLVRYTRGATIAWCAFFAAQLVVSLLLFLFAPLEAWSFFVNVLNFPLVLAMFLGEYACRLLRFPGLPPDKLSDVIRLVTDASKGAKRQADST